MTIFVLMYHCTPAVAESFYDVSLATFRDQILAIRDAGFCFARFGDCGQPEIVAGDARVVVTFDDTHVSNVDAFSFLHDLGIRPTTFIVRDWSLHNPHYLNAKHLRDLASICDLGAHGATHRALSSLTEAELAEELVASRAYVEDIQNAPVDIMALPGGHGGTREYAAAQQAGFRLVGNSLALPHTKLSIRVNRICIHQHNNPLPILQARQSYWLWQRARFAATKFGETWMGGEIYDRLREIVKS